MARRSTNAFGEAWQGSKIQGAGSLARARGYAYGALTSQQRGEFGSQANFQAAAEQAAQRVPDQQRDNPIQNYLRKLRPANPSGETDQQREERLKKKGRDEVISLTDADKEYLQRERLKKKGRDEVMTRDPDDEEITQEGREEALKELEAQWGALVNGSLSETALKKLEAQWGVQAPRAPGSLKLLGDTSPAALAKIRRAINRREQRPSYTPSGQVIRGGW